MKDVKTNSHLARVAMTLTLLICVMTGAWADDITAEQAREQALSFIQQHKASSGKTNRAASSATLPMTMTQVNGLYVFNIADDQGFVIVSNDDRTTPILGFSDNGSIDPDNMPSNMRAWLQGYADEIAWLQQNGSKVVERKVLAKTSSWEVEQPKTPIEPLIKTTWNQGEPYNNLCPEYAQGKKSITGCVATAMAQVMNYHQWPEETAAIPEYTDDYGMNHDGLPATTFYWNNMLLNYVQKNGNETTILGTEAQQVAVATLMQYCGWAVKMSYSSSFSGAYAHDVPYALKTYFNYDETAQYVNRSFYSYANWMDLIYYELSQRRPVLYSGDSSGGGHAFVCDGYQYENETDYFHINWGWGGVSDEYYVLSVLNPYAQGAGGSSSNDGFYYGQEAVIGIQRKGGTGTVANITTNDVDLTLNSVTLSSNKVVVGTPVTVTFNITNNSEYDYDGTIQLGEVSEGSTILVEGNHIEIPAGQTNDYTITYTPKKIGSYALYLYLPIPTAGAYHPCLDSYATLTVVEEGLPIDLTTSNITPVSATFTWTHDTDVTNYNLRYRSVFQYDFETAEPWAVDDFAPCTTYDGDGLETCTIDNLEFENSGYTGSLIAFQNGASESFLAHSGSAFGCFMAAVPNESITNNNDWFILPEISIEEGEVFSFWACSHTNYYGLERFKVGVYGSEEGTFVSYLAGSAETYVEAPTEWTEYRYDLSAYVGQTIRLAINCVSADAFAFCIDDIFVGNGTWTTLTDVTSPYKLSGLNADTSYEYQLQAELGESATAWTSSSSFTTLPGIALSDVAANNTSVIGSNHTNVVNVALDGRTLWQDGGWNTICLPFDLTIAGSVLDGTGVEARQLTEASITDKTLNLTFSGPVDELVAGTPYIIKWTSGDNIVDPVFTSVTINEAMNNFDNQASGDAKVRFIANYDKKVFGTVDTSILFVGEGNTLYYPESGATIGACRAYFKIGEDGAASRAITGVNFDFGEDDETTEIESVDDSQLSTLNSQLSEWYTLTGVKLEGKPTAPGIYICGGRRVVIK